jgi:two-component system nitrate/nitrite response regulator NarL
VSAEPALVIRPNGLRVALLAADPERRRLLAAMLAAAGHDLADSPDAADVLLADGMAAPGEGRPVLALGGGEEAQAGLLPREASPAQIDAALRAVAAGLVVRPAGEPGAAFESLADPAVPLLSPRELEILAAIGEGLSNKEVARRLGISPHTVKFHVESLFRKLGAVSRADAVAKGLRRQIIDL